MLLPELGIVGMGAVGSVILFGTRELEKMRDIALPSDSSTSKVLLRWLLNHRGLDPKCIETGPDLISMLERCDGALLIGDRALAAAAEHPELVCLDLGGEWTRVTGFPMVFGVFACRRDTPVENLKIIHSELLENYSKFNQDDQYKEAVIAAAAEASGTDFERLSHYFETEVRNTLDIESKRGLALFLSDVCGMTVEPVWVTM
jgi:chorismate dehydratase